jgi:hypothetical protein
VYSTDAQLPPDTDEMYCGGPRIGCPFGKVIALNADSWPNAQVKARDPPPERHIQQWLRCAGLVHWIQICDTLLGHKQSSCSL